MRRWKIVAMDEECRKLPLVSTPAILTLESKTALEIRR